jgi:hypothetical protein
VSPCVLLEAVGPADSQAARYEVVVAPSSPSMLVSFMTGWLLALTVLVWKAWGLLAAPAVVSHRSDLLLRVLPLGVAGGVALLTTFAVPIALVDDSSHEARAWWKAWLWPIVFVGMMATDAVVFGAAGASLLKVLKPE